MFKMMSFTRLRLPISLNKRVLLPNNWLKTITTGNLSLGETNEAIEAPEAPEALEASMDNAKYRKKHPVSLCLEYMESEAYNTTYGDKPVWNLYIRNFKGAIPPETRKTCVTEKGKIITGNPCPICRDEYLLPHYQNIKLLKQFISPYSGEILETKITNICQRQQFEIKVAIRKAQNYGLLTFPIPFRYYDYNTFYKK